MLPRAISFVPPAAILTVAATLLFAGCASSGSRDSSASNRSVLPSAFSSRWAPPAFATRPVDAERAAAIDAAVAAANSLGYSVNRIDGAMGKISAARRQTTAFDGARQDTLEISVTTLGPGSAQVSAVLREAIEPGSADERSGGIVTTALVRDRAPYDAFFARLTESLRPALASAAP